jgi:hypothetical protein
MSSMAMLSTGGGIPIQQTQMAPDGLEFSEDVSAARWVEESLSEFGKLRSLLPADLSAYARVFRPTPACSTPHILAATWSSRSDGLRWLHGPGEPSIP